MTRIAVLVCVVLGSSVVARAGVFYRENDPLAFAVTVAMGVCLALGLAELMSIATRDARLRKELAALPREASLTVFDGASEELRALLRARVEREPTASGAPVFTPYLVGLLVMLGLLGTFLGLFETLRGARLALTTSNDVQALREGLARPMEGLMRGFGTSAAGVSASAMLGLAVVFVRRDRRALELAIQRYVSGPLSRLSPARRQLEALEKLAADGEAMPRAADALALVTTKLADLGETMRALEAQAFDRTRDVMQTSIAQVVARLERLATETERAERDTAAAFGKLATELVAAQTTAAERSSLTFERLAGEIRTSAMDAIASAVARTQEAVVPALASGARELVATTATELDGIRARADVEARERRAAEERAEARLEAMAREVRAAIETSAARQADAGHAVIARLEQAIEALRDGEVARLEVLDRKLADDLVLRERSDTARLDRFVEVERERADRIGDALSRATAGLAAAVTDVEVRAAERADAFGERVAAIEAALRSASERLLLLASHEDEAAKERARDASALAAKLGETAERLGGTLDQTAARLGGTLDQTAARLGATLDETADRLGQKLGETGQRLGATLGETTAQLGTTLGQTAVRLEETLGEAAERLGAFTAVSESTWAGLIELAGAHEQRLAAEATKLVQSIEQGAARQESLHEERLARIEHRLAEAHVRHVDELGRLLGDHAGTLAQQMAEATERLREATELVRAGGLETSAVAQLFHDSVEKQREASMDWLRGLSRMDDALSVAGERAAADALTEHLVRTHELFDQQLRFQQELFEQLRQLRPAKGGGAHAHV